VGIRIPFKYQTMVALLPRRAGWMFESGARHSSNLMHHDACVSDACVSLCAVLLRKLSLISFIRLFYRYYGVCLSRRDLQNSWSTIYIVEIVERLSYICIAQCREMMGISWVALTGFGCRYFPPWHRSRPARSPCGKWMQRDGRSVAGAGVVNPLAGHCKV